jgi:hypothetical protein|tara:strand:- start:866 stop:1393 length:528 start_codon:yes stop_codon:yes gene_type:complete
MYFSSFPTIPYDSVGNGDFKMVTNLLKRVSIRSKVKANVSVFDTYDIKEGETPEMIADKLYDDSQLHWIVLMMNNITDRYHQWPKNNNQFLSFIRDKYDNPQGIHHYEINQVSGDTTIKIDIGTDNTDYPTATPITNWNYEEDRQDALRKIRLLDARYIEDFVAEFEQLIGESLL